MLSEQPNCSSNKPNELLDVDHASSISGHEKYKILKHDLKPDVNFCNAAQINGWCKVEYLTIAFIYSENNYSIFVYIVFYLPYKNQRFHNKDTVSGTTFLKNNKNRQFLPRKY